MKNNAMEMMMMAAMSTLVIGVSSCTTNNAEEMEKLGGVEDVAVVATDDGVLIVDTITITATVTAIDTAKRKLTLESDAGKATFKASPEMVNFDQIKVGDQVEAVVTEEIAVFIGAEAPSSSTSGGVMVSAKGGKPGGVIVETQQVTVVVTAIDADKRKVTFQLPDGSSKKVKVSDQVDLSMVTIGESLTIVIGEGLAITVTAP